jgi:hypothetical protein
MGSRIRTDEVRLRDIRGLCSVCGLREGHREWCERVSVVLRNISYNDIS